MFHDNTKHFEVDGHAMKQKVESGEVIFLRLIESNSLEIVYCPSNLTMDRY